MIVMMSLHYSSVWMLKHDKGYQALSRASSQVEAPSSYITPPCTFGTSTRTAKYGKRLRAI